MDCRAAGGYDYNEARIAEGQKLFERANAAVTARVAATGEYQAVARAEAARHAYQWGWRAHLLPLEGHARRSREQVTQAAS